MTKRSSLRSYAFSRILPVFCGTTGTSKLLLFVRLSPTNVSIQLRLQERDWSCRTQKSGRDMLYEFPPAVSVFHKYVSPSSLSDSYRQRHTRLRAPGVTKSLLPAANVRPASQHNGAHSLFWLDIARLFPPARCARIQPCIAGQFRSQNEGNTCRRGYQETLLWQDEIVHQVYQCRVRKLAV